MNLVFFQAAMAVYLIAAAGYISYFVNPSRAALARVSLAASFAGLILHGIYFILRWTESGHIPIASYFEAVNFLGLGIMLVFLVMEFRFRIPTLGSFMLPLVIVMMIPAALKSGRIEELKPILKSGWLNVHTSLAILGDAAFAFAFVVSVMYLIQERQLKSKHLGAIFHRLPPLDVMDTIGYKALTFGWPLFTLGMITGSIWAESAWGSYWTWDPKETWSLITWAVYLALLHLRTLGWRGKKMALLSIVGFVFLLISFYVISRLPIGRHNF